MRLMPVMLLEGHRLIKSVRFGDSRYLGDPVNTARLFCELGADELVVVDRAARRSAGPDLRLITDIAAQCFMPLAYGGGISAMTQVDQLVRMGVEKLILGQVLLGRPELLSEIACNYGAQAAVACVDVVRSGEAYAVYDHLNRRLAARPLDTWLLELQDRGAGEIILQSVDRDGSESGYDWRLYEESRPLVRTPLVALGGAASVEEMYQIMERGIVDAAAAGSQFAFFGPARAVLINYPEHRQRIETPDELGQDAVIRPAAGGA